MSSGDKRPHRLALQDAIALRGLFEGTFEKWEIAGSVRRGKPAVGDVEHVIVPKDEQVGMGGLFVEIKLVNSVWRRLDALIELNVVTSARGTDNDHRDLRELLRKAGLRRALYTDKNGAVTQRWGQSYRGVLWNGFKHELFMSLPESWGAQLLIRTGPPEYSKHVVDTIRLAGCYRQQDGYLVHVASGEVVPVPDEQTYLKLAGLPWKDPNEREASH